MSVTNKDAEAINTLLEVLFELPGVHMEFWREQRTENRVRDAAAHLASRAMRQLGTGVAPYECRQATLRVVL